MYAALFLPLVAAGTALTGLSHLTQRPSILPLCSASSAVMRFLVSFIHITLTIYKS